MFLLVMKILINRVEAQKIPWINNTWTLTYFMSVFPSKCSTKMPNQEVHTCQEVAIASQLMNLDGRWVRWKNFLPYLQFDWHEHIFTKNLNCIQLNLSAIFLPPIGLLQLVITWYKIRQAGGQAHYYSRTGTLKQRDLN